MFCKTFTRFLEPLSTWLFFGQVRGCLGYLESVDGLRGVQAAHKTCPRFMWVLLFSKIRVHSYTQIRKRALESRAAFARLILLYFICFCTLAYITCLHIHMCVRTCAIYTYYIYIYIYIYIIYIYIYIYIIYIYRKRRPEGPVFAGFMKITILILYPSL